MAIRILMAIISMLRILLHPMLVEGIVGVGMVGAGRAGGEGREMGSDQNPVLTPAIDHPMKRNRHREIHSKAEGSLKGKIQV